MTAGLFSIEADWLSFGLGIVLFIVYGDHLIHVLREWRHYRDPRSFHHLLIGFAVEIGMLAIVVSRGVRVGLWHEVFELIVSNGLTGSLLLVGAYLAYSWHRRGGPKPN